MTLLDYLFANSRLEGNCRLWTGSLTVYGYGQTTIHYKNFRVHRLAFALYHKRNYYSLNPILHSCDIRKCFTLEHLREGNARENIQDAKLRHRLNPIKGEAHFFHKLSDNQVDEIRTLISKGHRQIKIAELYNVSVSEISAIKHYRVRAL